MEATPPGVPTAKQGGEIPARWAWVEPSVWTLRMLTALETGVKGGVWFSLMDKVWSRSHLESAFEKVKANRGGPGVDGVTIAKFEKRLDEELTRLEEQLRGDAYVPQPVRRAWIPKGDGKRRPLGIPTIRDRIVQTALRNVLEPIFEREFAERSYGFRPGRGAKDALCRVAELLRAGCRFVVDADIQGYFDNIPKEPLLARVRERVADGRVLALLKQYLNQPVMEPLATWTPETGTPQGATISPLLANVYLNPLDHAMARRGTEMVRYADDFVLLCRTREEAEGALEVLRDWMGKAGLTLHPEKTRLVEMDAEGSEFEFLGYRFVRRGDKDFRFPRAKSEKKLRDRVRPRTRRAHGHSLEGIVADINPILRGWYEYFKHCHRNTFPAVDRWVRGRLRSILRKRAGGRGRGRGMDHLKWANAFFAEHGLFSLTTAHAQAVQPPPG